MKAGTFHFTAIRYRGRRAGRDARTTTRRQRRSGRGSESAAAVTFGAFAAQTLLDTKLAIGKLRGAVHRYHGIPVVVTYHPAALLRNPAWKRPTWADVQLARRILDKSAA